MMWRGYKDRWSEQEMGKEEVKMKELELYIHLPFCVKKCNYCDFLSGSYSDEIRRNYIEAVIKELRGRQEEGKGRIVRSVFFGGGTPSLLSGEEIKRLMNGIREYFVLLDGGEVSLEGNPGTFSPENLNIYHKEGINRLSIGCQSIHERELKILGRIHTFEEFRKSYFWAREAGFENINVDLMSGLPGQKLSDWRETLETVSKMKPEHISAYSLIVEEGTPFYNMELDLPDEDIERQMYVETDEILKGYGYRQYEISNYAMPGRECVHNIGYWKRVDYLGIGMGASSLLDNERFCNVSEMEKYLKFSDQPTKIREKIQKLSEKEQMEEFMFLGLRMREGVSTEEFFRKFRCRMDKVYGDILEKYYRLGLLKKSNGQVFLTEKGIHVSNYIFSDFLFDESSRTNV